MAGVLSCCTAEEHAPSVVHASYGLTPGAFYSRSLVLLTAGSGRLLRASPSPSLSPPSRLTSVPFSHPSRATVLGGQLVLAISTCTPSIVRAGAQVRGAEYPEWWPVGGWWKMLRFPASGACRAVVRRSSLPAGSRPSFWG